TGRAPISFVPFDSCERSRRPSGASGGTIGFLAVGVGVGITIFRWVSALATTFASAFGGAGCDTAARRFARRGLICLATASHNACSSSLSVRLRRGGSRIRGGRFIVIGGVGAGGGGWVAPAVCT